MDYQCFTKIIKRSLEYQKHPDEEIAKIFALGLGNNCHFYFINKQIEKMGAVLRVLNSIYNAYPIHDIRLSLAESLGKCSEALAKAGQIYLP
jgi:hypothetical protein